MIRPYTRRRLKLTPSEFINNTVFCPNQHPVQSLYSSLDPSLDDQGGKLYVDNEDDSRDADFRGVPVARGRDSIDISALTSFVIWHRTMLAH